jgi:hypothetical protein
MREMDRTRERERNAETQSAQRKGKMKRLGSADYSWVGGGLLAIGGREFAELGDGGGDHV